MNIDVNSISLPLHLMYIRETEWQMFSELLLKYSMNAFHNNCDALIFHFLSWLGQKTAKGYFGLLVKLLPALVFTTHDVGFKL